MINNVGGKAITGTARIAAVGELSRDGAVYHTEAISLAPGASKVVVGSIPGTNLDPTTYHVVGSVEYSYTSDDAGIVSTTVEDITTFILRGVRMFVTRGLDPTLDVGEEDSVRLTLVNGGNEDATNVLLREGIPLLGYVLTPQTNTDNPPLSLLTRPAATGVAPNPDTLTLDFTYEVGNVAPNVPYSVNYKTRGLVPGDYEFTAFVSYQDGIGDEFEKTLTESQSVVPPRCPLLPGPVRDVIGQPC
jgi:hypothetical protein